MESIQKINNQNILLAPNVTEIVKEELFKVVNISIAKCFAELNYTIPETTDYLVNEVTDIIFTKFPSLRIQEIPLAFSNGIRNKYGEYYGLCVVSFEQFISGYLESDERKKLVAEKNKIIEEAKAEPTPDEKFDMVKNLCEEAYNLVKDNKPVGVIGASVYSFLNSIELIHPDYKKGIMQEALKRLVHEKEVELGFCTDLLKRRGLSSDLEILKQNIANDILTPDQHEDCKRIAKRMVLTNWLRDMVLDDTDIGGMIEYKREFYKAKK